MIKNFAISTISVNDVDSLRYSIRRRRIMIEGEHFAVHIDLEELDTLVEDLNEVSKQRNSEIVQQGGFLRPNQWRALREGS